MSARVEPKDIRTARSKREKKASSQLSGESINRTILRVSLGRGKEDTWRSRCTEQDERVGQVSTSWVGRCGMENRDCCKPEDGGTAPPEI